MRPLAPLGIEPKHEYINPLIDFENTGARGHESTGTQAHVVIATETQYRNEISISHDRTVQ